MRVTKLDSGMFGVDVDGRQYEFEKWGADDSLDTLLDIGSVVGGPLGQAMAVAFGKNGDGLKTEITGDVASQVFSGFAANMRESKDIVRSVLKKLAGRNVICEGKKVVYDDHYAQNLGLLFQVARACFEVQYGSFFGDALASIGIKPGQAGASMSPAPTT